MLDIDRDRQRISLGLKQTQTDPWQQVLDSYREDDVVEGRVAKVVTFGAFVEILPGVEGLVHISELAPHHVENPREVVSQGDAVNVRILEIDGERRRLSLSLKRVEEGDAARPARRRRRVGARDARPEALRGGVPDRRGRRDRRGRECRGRGRRSPRRSCRGRASRSRRGAAEDEEIAEEIVAEVEVDEAEAKRSRRGDRRRGRGSTEAERRGASRRRVDAEASPEEPAVEVGSEQSDSD